MRKALFSSLIVQLLLCGISYAQKELTNAEVQDLYKLIKQTKEYKRLKTMVDSINGSTDQIPQELNIEILKKDQSAPDDDHIFKAKVERSLGMGLNLERYIYLYDQQKKQIISIDK